MQKTLCEDCAAAEVAATPIEMWSVDGCDSCYDGAAGHQVYDVPA